MASARIVLATLAAQCVAGGAAAAVSPETLVNSSIAAMRAQQSYHYVDRGVQPLADGVRLTIIGDATHSEGIQRITYSKGSRTGHVTVIVVANTAYIRGDAFTLRNYMLFSASQAASYSGKWLRLAHTASGFSTVAADVRLDSSALGELKMPSSVRSLGNKQMDGQRVTGLRAMIHHGAFAGVETLYVRSTGALPVEQTFSENGKLVSDVVYSGWGERVHVSTPTAALSLP